MPREGNEDAFKDMVVIIRSYIDCLSCDYIRIPETIDHAGCLRFSKDLSLVATKVSKEVGICFSNSIGGGISHYLFVICNPKRQRSFAGIFYDQPDIQFDSHWWGDTSDAAVMDLLTGSCANRTYSKPSPSLRSLNGEFMVVGMVVHKDKDELAFTVNGYDVKCLIDIRHKPGRLAFQLTCINQKVMLVKHTRCQDNESKQVIITLRR